MGFNTAVVAWAIPYCRVLKNDLSDCWWWSGSNQYNSVGNTLPEMVVNLPRSLYENVYRSPFGLSLSAQRHSWVTDNVVAKSLEVACDPGSRPRAASHAGAPPTLLLQRRHRKE